jgi:hypothetical protein
MDFARTQARLDALKLALDMHRSAGDLFLTVGVDQATTIAIDEAAVLSTADRFWAWTQGTIRVRLIAGPIRSQATGQFIRTPTPGDTMQLHDDEQVTYSLDTEDAKGYDTPDGATWETSDDAVASLAVSEDGRSCTVIAGVPGSATLTATIPGTDPALFATEAIDVIPGGVAVVKLTAGDVTKQ